MIKTSAKPAAINYLKQITFYNEPWKDIIILSLLLYQDRAFLFTIAAWQEMLLETQQAFKPVYTLKLTRFF
jgi:hypothetical protein